MEWRSFDIYIYKKFLKFLNLGKMFFFWLGIDKLRNRNLKLRDRALTVLVVELSFKELYDFHLDKEHY